MVVKAEACVGLSRCDHNYQLHEKDMVLSRRQTLLKIHAAFFPESITAYAKTLSGKCQRKCYVGGGMVQAYYRFRKAKHKLI